MALRKCPKCELNYIRGDAPYCDVCMRALRHAAEKAEAAPEDEEVLCSECGEAPTVHGSELCAECLKEQKRQKELENALDADDEPFDEDDEPLSGEEDDD